MKEIDKLMALADEYAKAWHVNQSSRMVAAYDDGSHRQALHTAIEQAFADQYNDCDRKLKLVAERWEIECCNQVEQALTAKPNINCKSVQHRLATQWGYIKADGASKPGEVEPTPEMISVFDPNTCDHSVFKEGTSVGLFDIPKDAANAICAGISAATGAKVDWHYVAGRVHIKALTAPPARVDGWIDPGIVVSFAVDRWLAEVSNRPLVNKHRRTLDDCWRSVIRRFGGDPEALLGPDHDSLLAATPQPTKD